MTDTPCEELKPRRHPAHRQKGESHHLRHKDHPWLSATERDKNMGINGITLTTKRKLNKCANSHKRKTNFHYPTHSGQPIQTNRLTTNNYNPVGKQKNQLPKKKNQEN